MARSSVAELGAHNARVAGSIPAEPNTHLISAEGRAVKTTVYLLGLCLIALGINDAGLNDKLLVIGGALLWLYRDKLCEAHAHD